MDGTTPEPRVTSHPPAHQPISEARSDSTGGAVHVLVADDETRLLFSGEIDAALSSEFTAALGVVRRSTTPVVLDLRHVHFMDSYGVAFVSQLAQAAPGRPRLRHVPPSVRFLLEVTHTDEIVDMDDA